MIEARDTTEEKRVQEELRNKEKQTLQLLEQKVKERTSELEKTNYELLQFTSVASHDLKEPVRKISIFSKMLNDRLLDSLDAASGKYLNTIIVSADRMARLIDDLLSFSRLSYSQIEYERVDLNEVFRHVTSDLELPIKEKHAEIISCHLPTIKGISMQWGQVFQNLLSNSLKFAHPARKPCIEIESETANLDHRKAVKIIYRDNGIGFKPEQAERIFDIFYRLHSKEEYEGTGVGLAIVKKIVESHGGSICAKSIQNQGAIFEIVFPVS